MNIKDKKVLVTGGAIRIGKAICEAFAQAGAKVIVHYRDSFEEAVELANSLPGNDHNILQCDLADVESVDDMLQRCGRVDILINNASVYKPSTILKESREDAEKQIQVNYLAPVSLMAQFAAQDIQEGCIINILDQEVAKDVENFGSYSISKRSLRDATLAAALELAPRLRVNGIAPGPVLPPPELEHLGMKETLQSVPSGKKTELSDITDTCLFLVKNSSITGQVIYVDGGQHLIQRPYWKKLH
ncbi:MAG: SDR family oxidoreductase [Lentisphaerae bacterium]|nr:SDR family oxidoreductase [Lentisphaerota bacterium]MCP4103688.1 SDR family oxidoreductase [Lentisphaerota bacterium]